jgi:purine nucleosidase
VAELLDFFERYDEVKYGTDGGPLHDPCVIAWLLQPDLFKGRRVHVEIETASERTMGMTVVDWWGVTGRPANATVITQVNADGFFDLLIQRLALL